MAATAEFTLAATAYKPPVDSHVITIILDLPHLPVNIKHTFGITSIFISQNNNTM